MKKEQEELKKKIFFAVLSRLKRLCLYIKVRDLKSMIKMCKSVRFYYYSGHFISGLHFRRLGCWELSRQVRWQTWGCSGFGGNNTGETSYLSDGRKYLIFLGILWSRTEIRIEVAVNFNSLSKTFRRTSWNRLPLQPESFLLGVFQQR